MAKRIYYEPQNTGWSGESSWFPSGTMQYNTYQGAFEVLKTYKKRLPDSDHRIVKRTIEEEVVYNA